MKKRFLVVVAVIFVAILCLALFACKDKTYTIDFDSTGGSEVASIKTNGKEEITMPDNPIRDGYSFLGWYTDKDVWEDLFTGSYMVEKPISSDITLYARWVLKTVYYTVTFDCNGADEDKIPYNATVILKLPQSTKTGYELLGWSLSKTDNTLIEYPYQLTKDIKLYAVWSPKTYTIGFEKNGGSMDSSTMDVQYMQELTLPSPTRTGHNFLYWELDGEQYLDTKYEYAKDIYLIAKWEKKTFNITYDYQLDGVSSTSDTVVFEQYFTLATMSREGYVLHWYFGDLRVKNGFWTIDSQAKDITLTARWIAADSEGFTLSLNAAETGYIVTGYTGNATEITIIDEYLGLPVTEIEAAAFENRTGILKITVPSSVKTIGARTFAGSTVRELVLSDSISYIGNEAFKNCIFESITLPSGMTRIQNNTFEGCLSLKSVVFGSGLKYIGDSAFFGCSSLVEVTLPKNVETIEVNAFSACTALRKVDFERVSKLSKISYNAFLNCERLKSIYIPSDVKKIEASAFAGCKALVIYCQVSNASETLPYEWESNWNLVAPGTYAPRYFGVNNVYETEGMQFLVYEDVARLTNYVGTATEVTVPETVMGYEVRRVSQYAFAYRDDIEIINLPSTVTYTENNAFIGCNATINYSP